MAEYECYVCGKKDSDFIREEGESLVLRHPIGWETDNKGQVRCPKHRTERKALATLGELIRAKAGVK